VRSFQPAGHRHTAELIQELGLRANVELRQPVAFSATAIELVRGVLVTAHVFLTGRIDEKTLWRLYRDAFQREPFIRLVKEHNGVYRYPEPKILAGSNFCDIGFELDRDQQSVVVIAALDNLMKGAAGNAVQALNSMYGWDESTALTFPGLHPV
jgi:N-acetyl-gamma-glutamyl-phosphate/LysW-gamma-L-alpha-aminoadipyl-6-phosphate reductase